ncbi:heptaprenyl diphosphate synthase component 1 [Peribacillus tepidiphilus]|uniref:heptaprenyl diphosphate synthase component 1 n=1 Tax=Peribacillus tepidiphilus TaxID=2652445 RepID=UPI0012920DF3|nr:heptaprenyl diphosphate synthase component 1 [Peribacillus tepidiphilus]
MMNITTYINELRDLIHSKASHPYLLQYLEPPFVDEVKLTILASLLDDLEISDEEKDKFITSTMLVQMALDTHEKVSNSKAEKEISDLLKNRQLTVLAGVYYSGLYYKILADIQNVSLIQSLATAIKDINEYKILLYQKDFDDVNQLLETIKIIECSLLIKVAEEFNKPDWKDFVGNALLLNRLLEEKRRIKQRHHSSLFEILQNIFFPKEKKHLSNDQERFIYDKLDRCIFQLQQSTEQLLKRLSPLNENVKEKVCGMLEMNLVQSNSFVEEG